MAAGLRLELRSARLGLVDASEQWAEAILRASEARRVVVLGATDMGKTSFIREVLAAVRRDMKLIDLDPGQKMIGPPGTVALGLLAMARVERFVFVGSTSASGIRAIARAAAELSSLASRTSAFIANSSGFVKGLGARLQAATVAALKPDLIVEIAADAEVPSLIPARVPAASAIRLLRSPLARRKSASVRARLRQEAFEGALEQARLELLSPTASFEPGRPASFAGSARPVCALADEIGVDVAYGILTDISGEGIAVLTAGPVDAARTVRLGRMWAEPRDGSWRLLETLAPSWISDAA